MSSLTLSILSGLVLLAALPGLLLSLRARFLVFDQLLLLRRLSHSRLFESDLARLPIVPPTVHLLSSPKLGRRLLSFPPVKPNSSTSCAISV